MAEFKTHFISAHNIDTETNTSSRETRFNQKDLELFISGIFEKRLEDKNARAFSEKEGGSRAIDRVKDIEKLKKDTEERRAHQDKIASFLLEAEKDVKSKNVKKGILVQSLLESEKGKYYLLAKIESGLFLSQTNWKKHTGIPYEKHVLKSCLIKFVKNPGIEKIELYDSNGQIAAFWYDNFLQLDPVFSDGEQTIITRKIVYNTIRKNIGKEDSELRQAIDAGMNEFFEKNDVCSYDKVALAVERIIDKNHPAPEPPLKEKREKLSKDIKKQLKSKKIDKPFKIDHDVVSIPVPEVIHLTAQIDLVLKDSIKNLGKDICIVETPTGKRYVKITVAEGYVIPGFSTCEDNGDSNLSKK